MLNVNLFSQRHIQNQVKHLQWRFFVPLTIFAIDAPSQMFDWVLNTPLAH